MLQPLRPQRAWARNAVARLFCVLALATLFHCDSGGSNSTPPITTAEGGPDTGTLEAGALDASVPAPTLRVLFLGNSYTYVNNLPGVIAKLGEATQSAARFVVDQVASGGQTWEGHAVDPAVDTMLQKGWDVVVLQDQSQQPEFNVGVKTAISTLDAKIKAAGAKTLLFMTWARKSDPNGYRFTQDVAIANYYQRHAEAIGAGVAPVGRAWSRAVRDPSIVLHDVDGSHPNAQGTYLAACVFYASLTGVTPVGLGNGGLAVSEEEATRLQKIAWATLPSQTRPAPPLLGDWPLDQSTSGDPLGNDFERSDALVLGSSEGPAATLPRATEFSATQFAAIPYFAGVNTSSITIALHAKRGDWSAALPSKQTIIAKEQGYETYQTGTSLRFQIHTTVEVDPSPLEYATTALTAGWHHFVFTYDGASYTMWVDKKMVASKTTSGALRYYTTQGQTVPTRAVTIGAAYTSTALVNNFTGALAGLRMYSVALSQTEIAGL